jgi:predicted enzyme related to lactoylglutathione lyase
MMEIQPDMGPTPPHFMLYVSVEDCDASAAKAQKLGGKMFVTPMDIPEIGRFSFLQDPQGAMFSIITLVG